MQSKFIEFGYGNIYAEIEFDTNSYEREVHIERVLVLAGKDKNEQIDIIEDITEDALIEITNKIIKELDEDAEDAEIHRKQQHIRANMRN